MLFELSAPPLYLPSFHLVTCKLDGSLQGSCGHTGRSSLRLAYPIALGWKSGGGAQLRIYGKKWLFIQRTTTLRLSTLPTNCDDVYLLTHAREDNLFTRTEVAYSNHRTANCYIFSFKIIKCCHMLLQNNEGPRQDRGSASCPDLSDRDIKSRAARKIVASFRLTVPETWSLHKRCLHLRILHAVIATSNSFHRR